MRRLTVFFNAFICTALLCLFSTGQAYAQDNFGRGSSSSTLNYTDWRIDGWSLSMRGPVQEIYLGSGPSAQSRQSDKDKIMGGGGAVTCCVTVPKVWPNGFKYIFRWQVNKRDFANDPYIKGQPWWPIWYKAEIELAPYKDNAGHGVAAQFLMGDRIKLVVNDGTNLPFIEGDRYTVAPPDDNDPYVFVGYPDEERNAKLMQEHQNDDWETKERDRRSDVVWKHIQTTQGKEAARIVSTQSLIEGYEFAIQTNRYNELVRTNFSKAVVKFKAELKERETAYGKTVQQILRAPTIQDAYLILEKRK